MSLCVPASVREKEESIKTVEDLLEKGLIEMANKDEQLKVCVCEPHQPDIRSQSFGDCEFACLPCNHNLW